MEDSRCLPKACCKMLTTQTNVICKVKPLNQKLIAMQVASDCVSRCKRHFDCLLSCTTPKLLWNCTNYKSVTEIWTQVIQSRLDFGHLNLMSVMEVSEMVLKLLAKTVLLKTVIGYLVISIKRPGTGCIGVVQRHSSP